jgi:hypothetical protein
MTTDDEPDDLADIEPWVLDEARALVERGEAARQKRRADRQASRARIIPIRPVPTVNRPAPRPA